MSVVPAIIMEVSPVVIAAPVVAVFTPIAGVGPMTVLRSRMIRRLSNRQPNLTVISNGQYLDRYLVPNG